MAFSEIHMTGEIKAEVSEGGILYFLEETDPLRKSRVALSGIGHSKAERIAAIINEPVEELEPAQ